MKNRTISGDGGAKIHVVVLDTGEEAFSALTRYAAEANISAASLTAIGRRRLIWALP
jgi:uncharacterized protein